MKLTQVLVIAACSSLLAEGRPLFFETLGSIASGTMNVATGAASTGISALSAVVSAPIKAATGLATTGINALSGTAGVATGVVTGLANTGMDTLRNIPNGPSGVAGAMAGGLAVTGLDAVSGGMGVAEGVATDLGNTGADVKDSAVGAYSTVRDYTVKGWTTGKKLLLLAKLGVKNPAMLKRIILNMG